MFSFYMIYINYGNSFDILLNITRHLILNLHLFLYFRYYFFYKCQLNFLKFNIFKIQLNNIEGNM